MSNRVPVYFAAGIELRDIIRAIRPMGWTLRPDARGRLIIIEAEQSTSKPHHTAKVVPFGRA